MKKACCLASAMAGLLLAAHPLSAKPVTQFATTTWTQGEGLPADVVRTIAQTSDGFLWIGTEEGLARFDGHEFTTFSVANGALISDFISTLTAARDGSLWIGTTEGLVHYAGGRFTPPGGKQGLPSSNIIATYEDRRGTLWVATSTGLFTIRNGSVEAVAPARLAPLSVTHAFFEDRQGILWISGNGLIRYDGTTFVPVLKPDQMNGLIANALAQDREGTIWIGGNRGILARTAEGGLRRYDTPERIPNSLVRTLWIDREGALWAGTNGGLVRLEGDRFVLQTVTASHDRLSVRSLFEDREGNLWMGSATGLSRLCYGRFVSYGPPEGWPADKPTALFADRKGDLWVGYNDSGLLHVAVTPTSVTPIKLYTLSDGLVSNEIFSIREARNGDILIATRSGLSRLHNGHFQNTQVADSLQRQLLLDVFEDPNQKLMLATAGDLRVQDGAGGWHQVGARGPLVIEEGAGGVVWVGTYWVGLLKIMPDGKTEHFTKANGLSGNRIRTLLWDNRGVLWIGTFGGGLVRFDGKNFLTFTTRDGLPSDNIAHIASDGAGNLWLSTTRGIARIAKADLEVPPQSRAKTLAMTVYGPEDGLRSLPVGPSIPVAAGGTHTRDGRLWFITGQSVAVTDPRVSDPQELLSTVVDASAGGKSVAPDNARIQPDAGPLQMRFTGLHLRAPQKVRYEYQLQGVDKQWTATSLRSVTYSGLRHGAYRFRVRSLLPGQTFPETSFAFVILPRFYETAWFLWLCAALLAISIYGAYQWRQRQIHSRFGLVFAERMRLAREIHDTLAQGFFGISSQLDALSLKLDDPEAARHDLNLARRMARHSLADARRSVMELRTVALEDCDLSQALASSAPQWIEGSPIELDLKLGQTGALSAHVEQNVLRIAQEAVVNAMRHARPSSIAIELALKAKRLMLRVSDNGCGFDASRSLSASEGHFGLIGMQERARTIGGEFELLSNPGQGTTVEVSVPL